MLECPLFWRLRALNTKWLSFSFLERVMCSTRQNYGQLGKQSLKWLFVHGCDTIELCRNLLWICGGNLCLVSLSAISTFVLLLFSHYNDRGKKGINEGTITERLQCKGFRCSMYAVVNTDRIQPWQIGQQHEWCKSPEMKISC